MKTIGFIDIHPQSPLCGPHISSPAEERYGGDQSAIYLFTGTEGAYTYDKTIDYGSQEELRDIDEFYASIPATILDFRILTLPFADKEKIAQVIPLELYNLMIGGSEEVVFDSIILGGDETEVEVLVAYIGKRVLKHVLTELARWNIDPRVVTSLDLKAPLAKIGKDSNQEEFLNSLMTSLQKWDKAHRINAALQEISEPAINFRTGEFAYTKDAEKTGRALRVTVVLGFLLALVINANILFQTIMIKKESTAIVRQMRIAYSSLFPGEKKIIDELYQLKSHIKEIKETGNILSGVMPLHLLLELSKRMASNVVYTDISLEKGLIKMKVEARSMDDLTKMKMKLSEFLTDVSISDVKPAAQGKILFTVVAKDQL